MTTLYKGYAVPEYTDSEDGPKAFRDFIDTLTAGSSGSVTYGTLANRPTATDRALYAVVGDSASNNGRLFLGTVISGSASWNELGLKVVTGTLANRPTSFTGNRIYIVVGDSTASNNGLTYFDTGSAWLQIGGSGSTVRAVATSASDVPVRSTGVASQTGNFYEAVTSGGTVAFAVKADGRTASAAGFELPAFSTANLPAVGAVGMLVYDTTASQVKVKTASATASYVAVGSSSALKATGTYTGDGSTARAIAVGFAPDLVVVQSGNNSYLGLITRTDNPAQYRQAYNFAGSSTGASVTDRLTSSGFVVNTDVSYLNTSTVTYAWSAFKIA